MSAKPTEMFEFTSEDVAGRPKMVKFVSFQSVNSLTLFIEDNHGDLDETIIQSLSIAGSPIQGTNMSELKKGG
jgi:hypothetical protein